MVENSKTINLILSLGGGPSLHISCTYFKFPSLFFSRHSNMTFKTLSAFILKVKDIYSHSLKCILNISVLGILIVTRKTKERLTVGIHQLILGKSNREFNEIEKNKNVFCLIDTYLITLKSI